MIYGLIQDSVTIMTGADNNAKAYENNSQGRAALAAEQSPEVVSEVMAVWGDTPTVPDYIPEEETTPTVPPTPTIEQRTAALESAMLTMLGGADNV